MPHHMPLSEQAAATEARAQFEAAEIVPVGVDARRLQDELIIVVRRARSIAGM